MLSRFSGHGDLPGVVHEIVEEYRNTGAHDTGRGLFQYLLENRGGGDNTMMELQVGVALSNIRLKDAAKTEAAVSKLIADFGENPLLAKGLFQIGEEHYYAQNYREAIELWEAILRDYADARFEARSEIYYVLATCFNRLGEEDKAIEYYKKSMEKYPKCKYSAGAAQRIAMIYMDERPDYDKAVYWFQQQRQLYPDGLASERALFYIGAVYCEKLGDYETAAGSFEQYIEEYPEGEKLWASLSNLAMCHEKLGNTAEALTVLEEALEKSPNENLAESVRERISNL